MPVVSKVPHKLLVRGDEAHILDPDFVGWDAISVELKSVPRHLNQTEFVQIFDYLKCRQFRKEAGRDYWNTSTKVNSTRDGRIPRIPFSPFIRGIASPSVGLNPFHKKLKDGINVL